MRVPLDELIHKRKIFITCGTGGVGKTTVSAAMAIRAAQLGQRVIVVTVDPAKRLATSLGIDSLGNTPTDLTQELKQFGPVPEGGKLFALMPDTSETFAQFFQNLAPNEKVAAQILQNPIFQILTRDYSGANEYMALQRLDQLYRSGEYDLIILDTPPSRNALAFFNAPRLLARFFEERLIRWTLKPASFLLMGGLKKALGALESLTGQGFITHLLEFFRSLFDIQEPFLRSIRQIDALLRSQEVGLLIVSAPTPTSQKELEHLTQDLQKRNLNLDGLILNRSLAYFTITEEERIRSKELGLENSLEVIAAVCEEEKHVIQSLPSGRLAQLSMTLLPELARDVHSLEDLNHVANALGASNEEDPIAVLSRSFESSPSAASASERSSQ